MSEPVVTVSAAWLRGILKKAKIAWPQDLVEQLPEQPCNHQWSRSSTLQFCKICGQLRE